MSKSIFKEQELKFVEDAAKFFEDPSVFIKGLTLLSSGAVKAQGLLPATAQKAVSKIVKASLERAVLVSAKTISKSKTELSFDAATDKSKINGWMHTVGAAALGGVSGFVGLAALPVELPITTLVILRSIIDTAKNYGFDVNSPEVQLECVYVFSMGSDSPNDDQASSVYYTSRYAFEQLVKEASVILGTQTAKQILMTIENGTGSALVRLLSKVATIFEIRITKKLIAQSVPVVGAVTGAAINSFFADYFKRAAKYHFGLRRLEIDKGREETQNLFDEFRRKHSKNKSAKILQKK